MKKALTIGELITKLKEIESESKEMGEIESVRVLFDFPEIYPTEIASWRGIYSEPALGYNVADGYRTYEAPTIRQLLYELEKSLTQLYEGWKGGWYTFTKDSILHVDNLGMCNKRVIVGVTLNGHNVTLMTADKEEK